MCVKDIVSRATTARPHSPKGYLPKVAKKDVVCKVVVSEIGKGKSDKYEIMLSDGQVINGVITTPYIMTVPYTKNPDSTAMGQTEIPEQKSISTTKKYSSLNASAIRFSFISAFSSTSP